MANRVLVPQSFSQPNGRPSMTLTNYYVSPFFNVGQVVATVNDVPPGTAPITSHPNFNVQFDPTSQQFQLVVNSRINTPNTITLDLTAGSQCVYLPLMNLLSTILIDDVTGQILTDNGFVLVEG